VPNQAPPALLPRAPARPGRSPGWPNRLRWGGLACGLALLAGCSAANAVNTGPFGGGGGDKNSICAPVRHGGVLSYGIEAFTNTGDTATIERVALTDPHGLRMLAAYAVPVTGSTLDGNPPARYIPPGVKRAQRQRADGAVIPHSKGTQINLVLVLKPTGAKGTARAVDVFYRAGGQHYHLQTNTSIEVLVAPSCPG
jgi:hypothetical protein